LHLDEARKCEDHANQHYTTAAQYFARVMELCDGGGANAFRNKFFPDLRKSRVYELLSIANQKKSVEEVKSATRARVARHRANKADVSVTVTEKPEGRETADVSVTVTERSETATEAQDEEAADVEDHTVRRPAKSRGAVTPNDNDLDEFTRLACRLLQKIANFSPERFQNTAIEAGKLAKLGRFLAELAKLKVGAEQSAMSVTQGDHSACAEQSAEEMKAKFEALDALVG
jgi:hypothetical protein